MHLIFCKYLAELSLSTTSDPQVIALRIAWAREHLVKKEDDGAFAQAVLDYYSDHPGPIEDGSSFVFLPGGQLKND